MTNIQIKVQEQVKAEVKDIFNSFGMDLTTGIKIYLNKVRQTKSIPFKLKQEERTINGFTPEQEKQMIAECEYAEKYGKSYTDVNELIKDALKED